MSKLVKIDASRVTWRRIEDELVVLDLVNSSYLSVNETGTALWPALARGTTVDELVEVLLAEFEVTSDVARHETEVFLDQLGSRGLLLESNSTPSGITDEGE